MEGLVGPEQVNITQLDKNCSQNLSRFESVTMKELH